MRNRQISLLDIGLTNSFDASMGFTQSLISNVNAGNRDPVADVNFVRSRDVSVVAHAFTAACDVLHVMAHGDAETNPRFVSEDGQTEVTMADLGAHCAESHLGIGAAAIIADGCKTGTGVWQRAVRDCLRGPVTYIGTSSAIGWHESTVFSGAFYGSLFRRKGKGATPQEQVLDAADRANQAYTLLVGKPSPYKVVQLQPSRVAIRACLV